MPLIKCPKCGNLISSLASQCPKCSCNVNINEITSQLEQSIISNLIDLANAKLNELYNQKAYIKESKHKLTDTEQNQLDILRQFLLEESVDKSYFDYLGINYEFRFLPSCRSVELAFKASGYAVLDCKNNAYYNILNCKDASHFLKHIEKYMHTGFANSGILYLGYLDAIEILKFFENDNQIRFFWHRNSYDDIISSIKKKYRVCPDCKLPIEWSESTCSSCGYPVNDEISRELFCLLKENAENEIKHFEYKMHNTTQTWEERDNARQISAIEEFIETIKSDREFIKYINKRISIAKDVDISFRPNGLARLTVSTNMYNGLRLVEDAYAKKNDIPQRYRHDREGDDLWYDFALSYSDAIKLIEQYATDRLIKDDYDLWAVNSSFEFGKNG